MHDPTEDDGGDVRPTRSSAQTLVGLLACAVLATVLFGQVIGSPSLPAPAVVTTPAWLGLTTPPDPDRSIGVESIRRCPVHLGGLALGDDAHPRGSAFERWDCDALAGPWSVVIRAAGGHFGVHGAVVTFPIDNKGFGTPVARPEGGMWNPAVRRLVWPLARSHAQIVGDLGQMVLTDLAMQITVEDGKPHVPALDGFAAATPVPYDPPLVHEMRYATRDLGQEGELGNGLVFTGVMSGASFESLAFESHPNAAGLVRGKPALLSTVPGGNGTLAWESAPGEVAYIGYSGSAIHPGAVEALRALANRARFLLPAQWQNKDRIAVRGKSR